MKNETKEGEFYHLGTNFKLGMYSGFSRQDRIYIGDSVEIQGNTVLQVNKKYNDELEYNIKIDDDVFINSYVGIQAYNYIEIGKYVMLGPNIYITDSNHKYKNFYIPIKFQGEEYEDNKIIIRAGAWIGNGCSIIGNVTIGYGSVIGAKSLVVKDVPNHVVAAGNPAQIIKICDYNKNEWINVKNNKPLLGKILSSRGEFMGYDEEKIKDIIVKYKVDDIPFKNKMKLITRSCNAVLDIFNKIDFILDNNDNIKTIELFGDAVELLIKIQEELGEILGKKYLNNLEATTKLNKDLNQMASAYEANDVETLKNVLKDKLIPDYINWKPVFS